MGPPSSVYVNVYTVPLMTVGNCFKTLHFHRAAILFYINVLRNLSIAFIYLTREITKLLSKNLIECCFSVILNLCIVLAEVPRRAK